MNSVAEKPVSRLVLVIKGSLVAALSFAAFGTVTALWENPFFIRMTPTSGYEVSLLALQAIMFGIYFSIPTGYCSTKSLSTGGVLGFLGVACPVCVFGSDRYREDADRKSWARFSQFLQRVSKK